MTILKTSELTGAALDWAVAKCEGYRLDLVPEGSYQPSTDWAQGGPIIEREMKKGLHIHGGTICVATYYRESLGGFSSESYGPTPLIAAMRCYCASKLGDTIDVPPELV